MIQEIARRYAGRWLRGYVRGKLRSDPVFEAAFDIVRDSKVPVLDVGCGIGIFPLYLRARGFSQPILGVDVDRGKIDHARYAAGSDASLQFVEQDAAELPEFSGHVVLLDVLHYLDSAAQRHLLESVCARVAPGGACIIRETPRDRSWRFRVTQFEELLLPAITWMKMRARHYPTLEELTAVFRDRGFQIEVKPLWGRTPFNSHLLVFRRQ